MQRPVERSATFIIGAGAVLGAAVTLYHLTRPGFLFGITPDISSWLGGSVRLVNGALPYRDFDLVHPPGFTLLALPFAVLSKWTGTRDALAVLRLCTPLLAAGNVLLIGKVVRHRGRGAVIVAGGVMAFFPAEVYAIRSGLLESVVDFFCLAGAALVFAGDSFVGSRRRLLLGGAAFGLAGAVKTPAIVPVVVLLALCLPDIRGRLLPFAAGVTAGFGIPTLPFFLAAPASFIRDVLSPLASIPEAQRVPVLERLGELTGISAFGGGAALIIGATAAIALISVAAFARPRRPPAPLEWFAIAATALAALAQLGPSYYFLHYAAFMAPFLGLLLALALARLLEERSPRLALGVAAAAMAVLLVNQLIAIHGERVPDIAPVVDAVIPAGGCTLSDAPSKLVTTDRFAAARPGCVQMIDPEGATLSYGYGSAGARRLWTRELERADYLVSGAPFAYWYIPPDAAMRAYVAENFRLIRRGGLVFYVRNGYPAGG